MSSAAEYSRPLFVVGTTLSAFLSGSITSFSLVTVPSLLAAPNHTTLLNELIFIFARARAVYTPLSFIAAALHAGNAYLLTSPQSYTPTNSASLFIVAAATTAAIVPFSALVMGSVISELQRREQAAKDALDMGDARAAEKVGGRSVDVGRSIGEVVLKPEEEQNETVELVRQWSVLNAVRGVLPGLGALAALYAVA